MHNKITRVDPTLFTTCLKLTTLDLSNNCLKEVPDELRQCVSLLHLDLSRNQLRSFPQSIAALTSLRVLCLDGNNTTATTPAVGANMRAGFRPPHAAAVEPPGEFEITDDLGMLRGLHKLTLSKNRIRRLPAEALRGLSELQELDVSHNALLGDLHCLEFCTRLESLNVSCK
eukprot:GHVU01209441.1.p2 GENE.GHVU01209441.1~~GHVU01209441.1.p2  ORF type:complete len:172 (+),score=25.05 GHVU01209441.1:328-843(+)